MEKGDYHTFHTFPRVQYGNMGTAFFTHALSIGPKN